MRIDPRTRRGDDSRAGRTGVGADLRDGSPAGRRRAAPPGAAGAQAANLAGLLRRGRAQLEHVEAQAAVFLEKGLVAQGAHEQLLLFQFIRHRDRHRRGRRRLAAGGEAKPATTPSRVFGARDVLRALALAWQDDGILPVPQRI
ncbi:MAG: hypothetical protein KF847_17115 [Pirellulales bacterium]|nr:hypothetical protein [Pirellulales bacterium]